MILKTFLVMLMFSHVWTQDVLSIGGIFYEDAEDMKIAFELSSKQNNLNPQVKTTTRGQILEVNQHICDLAKEGVIGIFDGTSGRASEHIQAVCDMLELPHVVFQHNDFATTNWSVLNMYPSAAAYNMMLEKMIAHKDWTNFTIIYTKGNSLTRVNDLLKLGNDTDRTTVAIRELSGDDYRDVLINAIDSGFTNFVVDSPSENLELFLEHAQQVGLMAEEYSFIFLSPDLFTVDLTKYRYGGVNITGFRLLNLKQNPTMWDFTDSLNAERSGEPLDPSEVKTDLVLIHDAVKVVSWALSKVNVTTNPIYCENYDSWQFGSTLLNFMRTNKISGITRSLNFDGQGLRTDIEFEVLEMTPAGNQSIGSWKNGELSIIRPSTPSADITGESIMRNKTFKILISTSPPYGYVKESSVELEGNDRYEGFTVDLIEKLSDMLGFSYEFEVENKYGNYDGDTNTWNGMVKLIMEEKADFGICDFTITAERQTAIDFSMPFMSLGIGILYKEPSKQPPEMFSFMAVFSKEVWINMLLVQLGLGVIMIIVGRLSHKEWQNPVPCIEQPDEFSNQFSFSNSIWLIIGSVMQQGSEIAPIAIAPRMITSVWWFFTMVMVALYTGTLVAFLIVENNVLPFQTVEELYEQKSIAYGAQETGSTMKFFKESQRPIYKNMFKTMKEKNWFKKSNDEGVATAEKEQFAFFMESTSIEYYKERHCDLLQIGGLLDTKNYGIGMKKGSEYKKYIDDATLTLKEQGEIQKLKNIWWKEKHGGGRCEEKRDEDIKQLDMKNMIGAFVVLGAGCLIGLLISIIDMLWGVFKRSVKYNTTFRYELIEELKFALKFSGDVKPVKRPPRRVEGSSEALDVAEAKDELKSLKSIKSSDSHRTHHSHSSKHSSRSQSVAFARMRDY